MFITLFLLCLLLFLRGTPAPKGCFYDDALSAKSVLPLRGFFMLLVMLHHTSQLMREPGAFVLLHDIGILCVSFFFFLSGYGLMKNHRQNPDYFHAFFRRRFTKLFIPFFVCNLLFILIDIAQGISYSPRYLAECLLGFTLINSHAWFILTTALFNLAFFAIFRFGKNHLLQYTLLAAFWFGYAAFCIRRGEGLHLFEGPWWFNSSCLFFFGVLFADFEPEIFHILKKYYRKLAMIGLFCFLLFYTVALFVTDAFPYIKNDGNPLSYHMLSSWFCLAWQSLAVFMFCLLIILFSMKFRSHNKLLLFLGTHAIELYLLHGLFIWLYKGELIVIENNLLFVLAVLFSSFLSAFLLHYPLKFLIREVQNELEKLPF